MGITGELVKSIFSRNRSFGTHENSGRSNTAEKRRWSSVRSYLCGDEFINSVLAEEDSTSIKGSDVTTFTISQPMDSVLAHEDSASVKPSDSVLADEDSASDKSSEATVTQPVLKKVSEKEDIQSEATETHIPKEQQNSISKLFREEDAAIIIQSAFRSFLARHQNVEIGEKDNFLGVESPSRESMGTSIEVQTGNSMRAFSIMEENLSAHQRTQQKPRTPILKTKEDWDDSTVSSNISRMRIQNRVEAMTRRERALAYAFSQQLRICSKKKQTGCNEPESSIGWSWLERWMATRVSESISVEDSAKNQSETVKRNPGLVTKKRLFDVAGEEKESCGSNEVSVQFENISVAETEQRDGSRLGKSRLKATRNISKRKTAPSYQIHKECSKLQAGRRDVRRETRNAKKAKSTQPGYKKETKCREASP